MIKSLTELSAEDRIKADWLMELAYVLQSVDHRYLSVAEGYEKVVRMLEEGDNQQIMQLACRRQA